MKLLLILSLAATALAQGISIERPSSGQTLTAGKNTTVTVLKPDTLTGSVDIGIGITLHHCNENPCESAVERLGDVLYAGPFNPQFGSDSSHEPFENFTVQIPVGFQSGPAVLSVEHADLVGAGPFFGNQIVNVTVNIK